MHVSYTVMGTFWTLISSHSGLSLYSKDSLAYGTAHYAISLGVNVVLTALIVARLLMYRRTHLAHPVACVAHRRERSAVLGVRRCLSRFVRAQ